MVRTKAGRTNTSEADNDTDMRFSEAGDIDWRRFLTANRHPSTGQGHPKVAESAIQVETSNEQASREPCVLLEPHCRGDRGESAEEPGDRAEMQERQHVPSDRSGYPLVREKQRLERSDHEPLDQDAMNHRYAAS